ncbi:MAG TPA: hypothetical protein VK615_17665 [Candidatus Binatia bacterium]|nr:hypothetical protein [Candidatus Binatia bacterium]
MQTKLTEMAGSISQLAKWLGRDRRTIAKILESEKVEPIGRRGTADIYCRVCTCQANSMYEEMKED